MQVLAGRHGLPAAQETPSRPLRQIRADLLQAIQLSSLLDATVHAYIPAGAVRAEMQIAAILAQMEVNGIGRCLSHSFKLFCNGSCAVHLFMLAT